MNLMYRVIGYACTCYSAFLMAAIDGIAQNFSLLCFLLKIFGSDEYFI